MKKIFYDYMRQKYYKIVDERGRKDEKDGRSLEIIFGVIVFVLMLTVLMIIVRKDVC